MNFVLLIAFCVSILAIKAMPFRQDILGQDADTISDLAGFQLTEGTRVFDAEPAEKALLRFADLQALPIMKKSIAIGRAGFRPGKRAVDIYTY